MFRKKTWQNAIPLHWKIFLMSFAFIVIVIMAGGAILIENFANTLEREIGARAMAIARTVAQIEDIQESVGTEGGSTIIQPIAEKIRLATDVEYIVIIDNDSIRYSHPLQDRIGEPFTGNDERPALANHEYISKAVGVMGPSVRAFVPLKTDEGTRQVGVVVVGILTPTISRLLGEIRSELYFSLFLALVLGLGGSIYLSNNIKKSMFDMEPNEIARLLEERIAVFQSIDEGIIAIDRDYKITIINDRAKKIMDITENVSGLPIKDIIPKSLLPNTVNSNIVEHNREFSINQVKVLVNRIPIVVKGETVGAVATFQDKTEVNKLAEELTGVKKFVEALRAQNHEHMNKLHTIAGLIQLEKEEEAIEYIFSLTEEQQELTSMLTKNIKDYQIAGLLLGKYGHAKELRTNLTIDPDSHLDRIPNNTDSNSLVVIIGNMLENALEAVKIMPSERRKVFFSIKQLEGILKITVKDDGVGIPEEVKSKIFEKGFSTKDSTNRGIGLFLLKRAVEDAGGQVEINSKENSGTTITVSIPFSS